MRSRPPRVRRPGLSRHDDAIGLTHGGSRDNLLARARAQLIAARSPLNHVDAATPPCFLVHAFDDGTVPVANSLAWITACKKANVSVEAHLFAEGGHGFGFTCPRQPRLTLARPFALWMRKHGG